MHLATFIHWGNLNQIKIVLLLLLLLFFDGLNRLMDDCGCLADSSE